MKRLLWSGLIVLITNSLVFGQSPPPNIGPWSGGTANAQPQGFGQGNPITLTWGFMSLGTPINDVSNSGFANAPNDLQTRLNVLYGNQATWQPLFQSVFDRWSSISGLTYNFEANDDGAAIGGASFPNGVLGTRADIRIGGKPLDGNSGTLAYNYFPNASEMVIDSNDTSFNDLSNNSLKLRNVVAHEHGHGLGMSHVEPVTGTKLMEPFVNLGFDGPQFHDILVVQRGYGDALEKTFGGLGNDVAARATSLGAAISAGQNRSIGNSPRINMASNNGNVAANQTDFVSIDSTTDTDFYAFTITNPGQVTLLLEALGFTYDAHPQGGGTFNFNTRDRSDLKLTLFDTNGTTQLAFADNTGFGGDEQIIFNLLAAGTYFVRVTGLDNPDTTALDTQFYGLTVSLAAVPEPTTVALLGVVTFGGIGGWWYRRKHFLKHQKTCYTRL